MAPVNNRLEGMSPGSRSATWNILRKLTGISDPESQLRGFRLQLEDGNRWWITGLPPASQWVERLAPIMQLHPDKADGANIIAFLEGKTPPERLTQLVAPDSGWLTLKKSYLNLWYRLDSPDLLVEFNPPLSEYLGYVSFWDALLFVHRQSLRRGGLPFHAVLAEYQGKGAILAGASGMGKSTCYRRLSPPWRARCDDQVLVALAPNGRYLAHPFPTWSHYFWQQREHTWKVQDSSPLAGIFFLEQSSSDECLPLSFSEAVVAATGSAQQVLTRFLIRCGPEEARSIRTAMFENACELLKKVPAFRLRVSLTGRFWEKIEAALGIT
jgi:SynChlorMet cassette protein ScmC